MEMFAVLLEYNNYDFTIFESLTFAKNPRFTVDNYEELAELEIPAIEKFKFENPSNESAPDQLDIDALSGELSQRDIVFTANDLPIGVTFARDWDFIAEKYAPNLSLGTQSSSSTATATKSSLLETNLGTISETASTDIDEDIQIVKGTHKATESISLIKDIVIDGLDTDEPLEEFQEYMDTANLNKFVIAFILGLLNALSLNKVIAAMVIIQGSLLNKIWNADSEVPFEEKLTPLYSNLSYTWTSNYAVPWFDEFGAFAFTTESGPQLDGYFENIKPAILAEDNDAMTRGITNFTTGMLGNDAIFGNKAVRYSKAKPAPRTFMYADFEDGRTYGSKTVKIDKNSKDYSAALILEHLKADFMDYASANNKVKAFWLQRKLHLGLTYQVRPTMEVELQNIGEVQNIEITLGPSLISLNPHDHGLHSYHLEKEFKYFAGAKFDRTVVVKRILRELWMTPAKNNNKLKSKKNIRSWYYQADKEDQILTI